VGTINLIALRKYLTEFMKEILMILELESLDKHFLISNLNVSTRNIFVLMIVYILSQLLCVTSLFQEFQ